MKFRRCTASGAAALQLWSLQGSDEDLRRVVADLPNPGELRLVALRDGQGIALDQGVAARGDDGSLELSMHGGRGVAAALRERLRELGAVEVDGPNSNEFEQLFLRARSPLAAQWLWVAAQRKQCPWRSAQQQGEAQARAFAAAAQPFAGWNCLARGAARLVFAGAPNAGKSSLLNAWLQQERVTVSPHPGTTRDAVEAQVLFGETGSAAELSLVDTAGLWEEATGNDAAAVQASERELQRAWRVLWVIDRAMPIPGRIQEGLAAASALDLVIGTHVDEADAGRHLPQTAAQFVGDFDLLRQAGAAIEACRSALLTQLGPAPTDLRDLPWSAEAWRELQLVLRAASP